jgi:hypothetical protein
LTNPAVSLPARGPGWIKLWRKLLDNPLFTQKPHAWLHVWMTILLKANWRDGVFFDGTRKIPVPAGSWVTSAEKLAANTRTSRATIRCCLEFLQTTNSITITTTKRWSMLTVTNWAVYQMVDGSEQPSEQPSGQPTLGEDEPESTANCTANTTATIEEIKKIPNTYKSNSGELAALQPDQPKRKPPRSDAGIDPVIREWFEQEFWSIYPRREGKQTALKAAAAKATTPEKRAFFLARLKCQLPAYAQRKADSGERTDRRPSEGRTPED